MAVKQKAQEDAQAKIAAEKLAAESARPRLAPMPCPKGSAASKPNRTLAGRTGKAEAERMKQEASKPRR